MDTPTPEVPLVDPEVEGDLNAQVIEVFEQRARVKSEPEGTPEEEPEVLPESPSEPSPAAEDDAPADPPDPAHTSGDGGTPEEIAAAGAGEPVGGEGTPGETAQPPAPAFTLNGQDFSPQDLETAIGVAGWFNRLNPAQVQSIDALLSGQYVLTPTTQASASPPPETVAPVDDGEDWLDPRAAQEIARLRTELDGIKSSLTPVVESQQQTQRQQIEAAIGSASTAYATERELTDQDMAKLQAAVSQSGIYPTFYQRTGGDAALAMRQALDTVFYTTPEFRDREVKAQVDAQLQQLSQTQRDEQKKQQQLSALSSTGGTVPRREPRPSTPQDKHRAMVDELNRHMNGDVPAI